MPRKPRIHYTETDKALMWDRWQRLTFQESKVPLRGRQRSWLRIRC